MQGCDCEIVDLSQYMYHVFQWQAPTLRVKPGPHSTLRRIRRQYVAVFLATDAEFGDYSRQCHGEGFSLLRRF